MKILGNIGLTTKKKKSFKIMTVVRLFKVYLPYKQVMFRIHRLNKYLTKIIFPYEVEI